MIKIIKLFFLLALVLSSCQKSETPESVDLKEMMPGTWESVSIKVVVNSVSNTDSSYVFDVPEKLWKEKLGVQPVKTYYQAEENKFYSEYIDLDGNITNVERGKWYVFGDTLMRVTPDATYQYEVAISGGVGTFKSMMDWDGDGNEDDEYSGVQRKISNYTK